MTIKHVAIVVVVLLGGWFVFVSENAPLGTGGEALKETDHGFQEIPVTLKNQDRGTVYVMFPPKSTSDEAERSRVLMRDLKEAGVPAEQISGYGVKTQHAEGNPEQMEKLVERIERFNDNMEARHDRGPPVVFLDGHVKADPATASVIEQYRAFGHDTR